MGQVARHKAAKASVRNAVCEPVYRTRRRERALDRAARRMASVSAAALVSAYVDMQRRALAHNVSAGVYAHDRVGAALH